MHTITHLDAIAVGGGGWHAGGYANSYSLISPVATPTIHRWTYNDDDFCSPTTCPICGDSVYFVRHNGGNVWLDSLGPPWPKHACFDDDDYSVILRNKLNVSGFAIFGVVVEVEATNPGVNGRIVVKCSNGETINSIFDFDGDMNFWLGKLVIVGKKDGKKSLSTVYQEAL